MTTFPICQTFSICFYMCVASDLESKFINVHNQRQTLIGIIEQYITSNRGILRLLGAPGWNLDRGPISDEEEGGKAIYFGIWST